MRKWLIFPPQNQSISESTAIPFRGEYGQQFCDKRREWVEQVTGVSLDFLGQWPAAPARSQGICLFIAYIPKI